MGEGTIHPPKLNWTGLVRRRWSKMTELRKNNPEDLSSLPLPLELGMLYPGEGGSKWLLRKKS
jgi:hypothetical protein